MPGQPLVMVSPSLVAKTVTLDFYKYFGAAKTYNNIIQSTLTKVWFSYAADVSATWPLAVPVAMSQVHWQHNIMRTRLKRDTFGNGTKCLSKSKVCLIESQIKGVKKGKDQFLVSILQSSQSYKGVY